MADLKTLKYGELYLMKDGSAHRIYTGTDSAFLGGFVYNGTWNTMRTSTDVFRKTGNHFLTTDFDASLTTVFNPTHAVQSPVFFVSGSVVYMWYGYDALGGAAYSLHLAVSSDGGASWTAVGEMLAVGTGGSWNDASILPVGATQVDADLFRIHIVGNDGAVNKLGVVDVDTSVGGFATDIVNAAKYAEYGSNPITPALGSNFASVAHDGTTYHLYHSPGSSSTVVYHNTSSDGLTWPGSLTGTVALQSGVSGTYDDAYIRTRGSCYKDGWYYLFYTGNDGTSNYAMLALSQHPDRLIKCGNVESLAAYSRVRFAADLTYENNPQAIHVPERNRPGVLLDAQFEPFPLSFTFKQDQIGGSDGIKAGATAEDGDNVWNFLALVSPSVREGSGNTLAIPSVNILYRLNSDANGTKDDFHLFLECVPVDISVQEMAEGNTVTVTMMCHGGRMPLVGQY